MARIVVIGAGIAGLAAAIRLADFGHDVTLVERTDDVGGLARPLSSATSPVIDPAPSAFTLPAVLRDLFRKTGRPLERCVRLIPPPMSRAYVFSDGRTIGLPNANRAGVIDELDRVLGAGSGRQWDAAVRAAGELWGVLRTDVFGRPFTQTHASRRRAGRAIRAALRESLAEFARRHLTNPALRSMLCAYADAVGARPGHASSGVATLAYLDQTFGVWTVDGGIGALVEAMQSRAVDKRVTIQLRTAVHHIATADGRVSAVETSHGRVPADIVVSTVPPDHLYGDLATVREPPKPASTGSALSVVVNGAAPAWHTSLIPDDGGPTISVIPQPGNNLVIHAPCEPHGAGAEERDWTTPGVADEFAATLVGRVSKAGIDVGDEAPRHVRTPYDLEQLTSAPGGRVYGAAWLTTGDVRHTPGNQSPIEGLFLAGGGVHPGPTIPFSVMSADIVADLIGRA